MLFQNITTGISACSVNEYVRLSELKLDECVQYFVSALGHRLGKIICDIHLWKKGKIAHQLRLGLFGELSSLDSFP